MSQHPLAVAHYIVAARLAATAPRLSTRARLRASVGFDALAVAAPSNVAGQNSEGASVFHRVGYTA